jgi:nucleoside-diphosphate-sugar epimerase
VDVRDIASAAELSLNGNMAGIFNIASEESVSNLALAEKCIKLCGSLSKITFNGLPDPEEGFNWDVSIEKAKREMGYSPRYALDQSIQSVMDEARIEN